MSQTNQTIRNDPQALMRFIETHQELLKGLGFDLDGKNGVDHREFGQAMLADGKNPMMVLDVPEAELADFLKDVPAHVRPRTQAVSTKR